MTKAAPVKKSKPKAAGKPLFLRFSTQDQIVFAKRLAMILKAGMPIMEGLAMLSEEARGSSSKYIFGTITRDIRSGSPLSTSLSRFDNVFGKFCINVVRVGESSGTLHQNLEYLSEELKKKQALRRRIIGALIYPALIVTATLGITVLLTLYIFPKILPIFKSVHATLPFTTRALIAISSFLSHYGWWVLGIIIALFVGFILLMRYVRRFHYTVDVILMYIPIFGKLSLYYNSSDICRTLAILLNSGAPIVQSIDLVASSTRNLAYERALRLAGERLVRGQRLAEQFKEEPRLFPPMLAQMVLVGESTGNLSSTLEYLSHMYEEEVNELTKNLTSLLEPILMIIMGVIVGFVAVSIITPIYSITQSLGPH